MPKEESNSPAGLEDLACKILNVEKVTNKILSNYLKSKSLKSSGPKLELLQRVIASSKTTDDTRQDNTSVVETILLASEAGVHQEDDLDPDEDDEEDPRD